MVRDRRKIGKINVMEVKERERFKKEELLIMLNEVKKLKLKVRIIFYI